METKHEVIDRAAVAVAAGDIKAFECIYESLYERTSYMIRTFIFDLNEHEDILHDLMLMTIRLCHKYNDEVGHFEHYAYRTFRYTLMKLSEEQYKIYRIKRPFGDYNRELYNIMDTDEERLPEDRMLAIELMRESLKKIEKSARFSGLERSVLSGLMNGQTPLEVRETLNIDESSYTNTFYRMRNKVKSHPILVTIDNEPHNRYSI